MLHGILALQEWPQSHLKTPEPVHRLITSCRCSLCAEGLLSMMNVHLCWLNGLQMK